MHRNPSGTWPSKLLAHRLKWILIPFAFISYQVIPIRLQAIYQRLLKAFGPQGWWPVKNGFKPRELEIIAGALLTQNTNWANVEKALGNMRKGNITSVESIISAEKEMLAALIRPAGYYNQKAERLKILAETIVSYGNVEGFLEGITREGLLKIKGIGPETADSILLYAAGRPFFVVDAYTRRVFSRLGMIGEGLEYEIIRAFFEENLERDPKVYSEFHALIVELAKRHCRKRPECKGCPLGQACRFKSDPVPQQGGHTPKP